MYAWFMGMNAHMTKFIAHAKAFEARQCIAHEADLFVIIHTGQVGVQARYMWQPTVSKTCVALFRLR